MITNVYRKVFAEALGKMQDKLLNFVWKLSKERGEGEGE